MNILAVAAGGFVGAILRYLIAEWFVVSLQDPNVHLFPYATLVVNLVGCLLLGWFLTMASMRWTIAEPVRLGIATGLLGSFTTFSTFSLELLQLIAMGHLVSALLYVIVSMLGGILAAALGWRLALRLHNSEEERS